MADVEPGNSYSPEQARDAMHLAILSELDRAYSKHGDEPWGRHEFYGILKEEVDELWDDIKADAPTAQLLAEVQQIAAVCYRYAETGDRYRGQHPSQAVAGRLARKECECPNPITGPHRLCHRCGERVAHG